MYGWQPFRNRYILFPYSLLTSGYPDYYQFSLLGSRLWQHCLLLGHVLWGIFHFRLGSYVRMVGSGRNVNKSQTGDRPGTTPQSLRPRGAKPGLRTLFCLYVSNPSRWTGGSCFRKAHARTLSQPLLKTVGRGGSHQFGHLAACNGHRQG